MARPAATRSSTLNRAHSATAGRPGKAPGRPAAPPQGHDGQPRHGGLPPPPAQQQGQRGHRDRHRVEHPRHGRPSSPPCATPPGAGARAPAAPRGVRRSGRKGAATAGRASRPRSGRAATTSRRSVGEAGSHPSVPHRDQGSVITRSYSSRNAGSSGYSSVSIAASAYSQRGGAAGARVCPRPPPVPAPARRGVPQTAQNAAAGCDPVPQRGQRTASGSGPNSAPRPGVGCYHGRPPVPSLRSHLQHVCAVRTRLRAVAPTVAATLDAAWPSAALGALAADVRFLTGEPRQATHGYDHRDPDSLRAGAREWLARRPDAAALLRRPDAPAGHVAFVLGYVCHVAFDAWWGLGRLGLLGPDGPPSLPRGIDLLPFDPGDRVGPAAVATAPLPDGYPQDAIRQLGEIVREMGTCDPDEMLRLPARDRRSAACRPRSTTSPYASTRSRCTPRGFRESETRALLEYGPSPRWRRCWRPSAPRRPRVRRLRSAAPPRRGAPRGRPSGRSGRAPPTRLRTPGRRQTPGGPG